METPPFPRLVSQDLLRGREKKRLGLTNLRHLDCALLVFPFHPQANSFGFNKTQENLTHKIRFSTLFLDLSLNDFVAATGRKAIQYTQTFLCDSIFCHFQRVCRRCGAGNNIL